MENKLITPRKIQGFWELMPSEEALFEDMLTRLRKVFENNCFQPLDTPVAEFSEILLAKSGGDVDKEIYRFTKGHADICLRYDLTVPLARFVAGNVNELDFPFKRYQIGKVYRGERPQKGRFREFYQCDADVIGENLSLTYDAECIKLYEPCFKELNLDAMVEISNRKLLAGYFESLGGNVVELMTIVDKLDKLPKEEIVALFKDKDLKDKDIENTMKLVATKGDIFAIKTLSSICENETFKKGMQELETVDSYLKALGMQNYLYNLSIVRGHDYYTGTVFECYIKGKRNLGAIGGGGRYDNLCKNFMETKMEGVGMSIGITRLFDILRNENLLNTENYTSVGLGIITFNETLMAGLTLMSKFRDEGVKADIINETKSFKAKMKEANKRNLPYIIILGEDEVKAGIYTLKDMRTGEQEKLKFDEILEKLK